MFSFSVRKLIIEPENTVVELFCISSFFNSDYILQTKKNFDYVGHLLYGKLLIFF